MSPPLTLYEINVYIDHKNQLIIRISSTKDGNLLSKNLELILYIFLEKTTQLLMPYLIIKSLDLVSHSIIRGEFLGVRHFTEIGLIYKVIC